MVKSDPYDRLPDAVDPGDPAPPVNSGFVVERAVDPGEIDEPEGASSEEEGEEEGEEDY